MAEENRGLNIEFNGEIENPGNTENTKGRGRPKRDVNSNNTSPASASNNDTDVPGFNVGQNSEIPVLNISKPEKEKKSSKKSGKEIDKTLESNVRTLIQTGFSFLAGRVGDNWNVSDDESKAISEPLTKILQKYGASKALNKYGDIIALGAGITCVVAPRLMEESKKRKDGKGNGRNEKKVIPVNITSDGTNKTDPSGLPETNIKSRFDVM